MAALRARTNHSLSQALAISKIVRVAAHTLPIKKFNGSNRDLALRPLTLGEILTPNHEFGIRAGTEFVEVQASPFGFRGNP